MSRVVTISDYSSYIFTSYKAMYQGFFTPVVNIYNWSWVQKWVSKRRENIFFCSTASQVLSFFVIPRTWTTRATCITWMPSRNQVGAENTEKKALENFLKLSFFYSFGAFQNLCKTKSTEWFVFVFGAKVWNRCKKVNFYRATTLFRAC